MVKFGRLIRYFIFGLQLFFAAGLLLSAYASYLHPQTFSFLSCAGLAFPFLLIANLFFLLFWAFFYWRYAALQLLVFLLCAGPLHRFVSIHSSSEALPEQTIKVLTFNTEMFAQGQPHHKKKKNPVMTYLQMSKADIICLQECAFSGDLSEAKVASILKRYKYRRIHGSLACYSRYPILSAKEIDYKSEGNRSVAYRLKINKDTVLLINNHLESNRLETADKEVYKKIVTHPKSGDYKGGGLKILKKLTKAAIIRSQQAEAVAKEIQKFKGRGVIVCGDFNDTPYSYAYRTVRGDLKDAFVDSGRGMGISYHRSGMYYRIDHLLVSPSFKTYRCTVDSSIKDSDHYPVWCYLSWD